MSISCVSEAWTLLKKGHTESNDTVMYFLKACDGVGLCAEALKYIPAGYHVGECLVIQQLSGCTREIELWNYVFLP